MRLGQFSHVSCILFAEYVTELLVHQMIAQRPMHGLFEFITRDRLFVIASGLVPRVRAADPTLRHGRAAASTDAALDQIGKDISWSISLPEFRLAVQACFRPI